MTNKYAANCSRCSKPVPAGSGTVERIKGMWIVKHESCEPRKTTHEQYIETARSITSRGSEMTVAEYETWIDEVATIATEMQCGILHASHEWHVAHPPETRCDYCEEPFRQSRSNVPGAHALCKARFERGGPAAVKPIPYESGECYCSPCSQARGTETPMRFSATMF